MVLKTNCTGWTEYLSGKQILTPTPQTIHKTKFKMDNRYKTWKVKSRRKHKNNLYGLMMGKYFSNTTQSISHKGRKRRETGQHLKKKDWKSEKASHDMREVIWNAHNE